MSKIKIFKLKIIDFFQPWKFLRPMKNLHFNYTNQISNPSQIQNKSVDVKLNILNVNTQ